MLREADLKMVGITSMLTSINPIHLITFQNILIISFYKFFTGSNINGSMGLQLPPRESQGMGSRGSYTPTTEEDLDMIQVK